MAMKHLLSILLSAFLLTSCETTSTISLDLQRPAEISFSSPVSKILVVDHSISQPNDYGHLVYAFSKKQENLSFDSDSLRRQFVINLSQNINLNNGIEVLNERVSTSREFKDASPLDSVTIVNLANRNGANVVVSVDNCQTNSLFRLRFVPQEGLYRLTFDAIHSSLISVYQIERNRLTHQTINHKDSLFWENYDFSSEALMVRFPDRKLCMEDMISHSANRLSNKLFTHRERVLRMIYCTTSSNMLDAKRYAKQNKWTEAAYIWEYIYGSTKSTRLKGFCAANLALTNEVSDQFDQAIEWADIAKDLFRKDNKSKYIGDDISMDKYVKELIQRRSEVAILRKLIAN